MTEKKIFLNRLDDLNVAVDLVIKAAAERVILNIPRDSVLGKTIHNLQVLKRESETAGKDLFVESVDDHILELAALAGLRASNPVFKTKERMFADILPRAQFSRKTSEMDLSPARRSPLSSHEPEREFAPKGFEKEPPVLRRVKKKRQGLKRWHFVVILTLVVFIFLGLAVFVLPRATVVITLKKIPVAFDEKVEASSQVKEVAIEGNKILLPGELLIAKKNLQMDFEAHGKEIIGTKASGTLTVYNSYSSRPQTLVKSTRFETPDKKIFRLTKQVTIPGAQILNGKIKPSKIEVSVIADEVGDSYNIPPTPLWRIPGFKGTPRYEGFYAESVKPMSGGFAGERAVPTKEDLELGRKETQEALESILKNQIALLLRGELKVLEGASSFRVTKEDIGEVKDGRFSLFQEGEMRYLVFDEAALKNTLVAKYSQDLPENLRVFSFNISYTNPEVDLILGKESFGAKGSLVFESNLDREKISKDLLGKDGGDINAYLSVLPGLEKAKVSLWPFWVTSVPNDSKKVKITIE